jgi:hypothetical protein
MPLSSQGVMLLQRVWQRIAARQTATLRRGDAG